MIIVSAKRMTVRRRRVVRSISGPLETAMRPSATSRVTPNTALNSGSSQHGKARRQSVDCIWVVAITCWVAVVVDVGAAVEAAQLVVEDAARTRWPGVAVPASIGAAGVTIMRSVASSSDHAASVPSTVHEVIVNSAAFSTRRSVECSTSSWITAAPSNVASSSEGRSRRSYLVGRANVGRR